MEFHEIDVFIEPDGQVRLEVRGVKGSHCLTVTKDLEKVLGGQIVQREMTSEAGETPVDQATQQKQEEGTG